MKQFRPLGSILRIPVASKPFAGHLQIILGSVVGHRSKARGTFEAAQIVVNVVGLLRIVCNFIYLTHLANRTE